MTPKRLKKIYFIIILILISGIIATLIIYALNQNINLFYTPTQIAQNEAPQQIRIRVGGMVEKGSLLWKEGVALEFIITDFKEKVKIEYKGILPDLFREGQGVVALGRLMANNIFVADQILAKHDENYMPPEIRPLPTLPLKGEGVDAPLQSHQGAGQSQNHGKRYLPTQGNVYSQNQSEVQSQNHGGEYSQNQGWRYLPNQGNVYSQNKGEGQSQNHGGGYSQNQGWRYLPNQGNVYSQNKGEWPLQNKEKTPLQNQGEGPISPPPPLGGGVRGGGTNHAS